MFTHQLGKLYKDTARLDESEKILTKTLELSREVFSEDDRSTQATRGAMVDLYLAKSDWVRAVSLAEELVSKAAAGPGAPARRLVSYRIKLARGLAGMKKFSEAEAILLDCHDRADPAASAAIARYLVDLYDSWGKPEEATKWRAKLPTDQPADESDDHAAERRNP